jgi:hypothetical protein
MTEPKQQSTEVPEEVARLLAKLEEVPFSTSDGSDDPNRASLIDALRRFQDEPREEAASGSPKFVPVFRYEGGDLNYEPPESAPDEWDGNLNDLIGDYVRRDDHRRRVEALKHEQMVKVTAEAQRADQARKQGAEEERERLKGAIRTALRDLRRGHIATVEDGLATIVGDEKRDLGLRDTATSVRTEALLSDAAILVLFKHISTGYRAGEEKEAEWIVPEPVAKDLRAVQVDVIKAALDNQEAS